MHFSSVAKLFKVEKLFENYNKTPFFPSPTYRYSSTNLKDMVHLSSTDNTSVVNKIIQIQVRKAGFINVFFLLLSICRILLLVFDMPIYFQYSNNKIYPYIDF